MVGRFWGHNYSVVCVMDNSSNKTESIGYESQQSRVPCKGVVPYRAESLYINSAAEHTVQRVELPPQK
jgi:hypothetical protein